MRQMRAKLDNHSKDRITLDLIPFLAALISAIAHAGWNAAARGRPDPGSAITATVVMAGIISIPIAIWLGLPPLAAWPWLILGILFNTAFLRLLMAVYRTTPFSLGYPMTRGTIPLAVTVLHAILPPYGIPSTIGMIGIAMISAGVMLQARSGRQRERIGLRSVILALSGGFCAAGYVLTDVAGIAETGNPLVYGVAAAIVNAVAMPVMLRLEGTSFKRQFSGNIGFGLFTSLFSMGSYVLFLYALAHGPVGPASAIRETSVIFALLIAMLKLREKVGLLRWIACGLAFGGTALLRLS